VSQFYQRSPERAIAGSAIGHTRNRIFARVLQYSQASSR